MGIYFYEARWYDPYLSRWLQPDPIIQDIYNPLDLDRFAYVRNNAINYNDPTGYDTECGLMGNDCGEYQDQLENLYEQDPSLEESGVSYDDFVRGYEAYEFYGSHPDTALQDCIDDTDSYALARIYSEYFLHQLYQPFDEGAIYVMAEQASKSGNVNQYYSLVFMLAAELMLQGPDKGFGGGTGFKLTRLKDDEIKMLKKAGYDIHLDVKSGKHVSRQDLYRDAQGNIFVLPKNGKGEPDPTGININDVIRKLRR